MKRDPWAWAKKKQRPAWKKYAQTAAALLLVAGLGLAASPTARADIVRLAVEWNQNRASFVYSGPDVGDELPCYVLGDLPEGYVQTDWQRLGPALVAADYESADGDYLYLDYSYMQQGGGTFIDMEEGEVIETRVNGMEGYFFQDADPEAFDILTWIDTRQNIQFTLGGCMDLDQALALLGDLAGSWAMPSAEMAAALLSGGDVRAAAEEIQLRSRQYAKRQLTWFKRNKAARWLLWGREPDFAAALQTSTEYMEEFGLV